MNGNTFIRCTLCIVDLSGLPVLKPCVQSACIGRIREATCLFGLPSRELVPLLGSIRSSESQKNRSSTVSVSAANVERSGENIGRDALSRTKIF